MENRSVKSGKMERRAFLRISLGVFAVGFFWASVSIAGRFMSKWFPGMLKNDDLWRLLFNTLAYLAAALILWLFLKGLPKLDNEPKQKMKAAAFVGYVCTMRGAATMLSVAGAMVYLLVTLVVKGPQNLTDALRESNPFLLSAPLTMAVDMVLICIVAPVMEELMFRRLLLDALRPFGDAVAILYSGVAFGLLHMNFQQFFYASGLGLMLGYVMARTNDLRYCIGLHAALNTMSAVFIPLFGNVDMANLNLRASAAFFSLLGVILVVSVTGIVLFVANVKKVRLEKPRFRFTVPINGKLVLLSAGTIPYILVCVSMAVYYVYIA